jgi:molecular chaperone Hsp33
MSDTLVRALAYDDHVRVFACNTTELVRTLRERHDALPTATAALGRLATAAALMGVQLKGAQDQVILKINGGGPLGTLLADADAQGRVRATIDHPDVEIPLLANGQVDVASGVGTQGVLTVIKDMGLKDPYQGSISLVNGEVGDDLTQYFAASEQTPTALGLSVVLSADEPIKVAGGFLLQLMPNTPDAVVALLEHRLQEFGSLSSLLQQGQTPTEILETILGEAVTPLATVELQHHCNCSRERMERALFSLGANELQAIVEEDGEASLQCNFCREQYRFDKPALEKLVEMAQQRGGNKDARSVWQ